MTPLPFQPATLRLIRHVGFFVIGMVMLGALAYIYAVYPAIAPSRPLFWMLSTGSVALVLIGGAAVFAALQQHLES